MTPEEIKKIAQEYAEFTDGSPANKAYIRAIAQCFTEWLLKDFFIVPKNKVNALRDEIFKEIMDAHDADDWQSVAHYILDVLPRSFHAIFGDKCLPDKEHERLAMKIDCTDEFPDKDPETKDNMEEKDYPPYLDRPKQIVPTMKEKELNLCELLSDDTLLESEFYSPAFGKVNLSEVRPSEREVVIMDIASAVEYSLNPYGCLSSSPHGFCILFPSRALYEKYPLDAYSAWMEWKEERKPKRWGAKLGDLYYCFDECLDVREEIESEDYKDNISWNVGNYFRSKEETQEAIKIVKEYLKKFHENKYKV